MLHKQDPVNVVSRYRHVGIYFFVCIALILIGTAAVEHQAVYNQLYSWKLIPRPERLTELYFTDPQALPTTYVPGQEQTVAFTVHNIEYRPTTYTYTVQQVSNGTTGQPLATGVFRLIQNQTKQITVPVMLASSSAQSKVQITLAYNGIEFGHDTPSPEHESIYYLVGEQGTAQ